MITFEQLGLQHSILQALADLGYQTPSEIQAKAIPELLDKEIDIKAFAQTGTGKTAAFSLPILELLDASHTKTQALILSPTRELAVQIGKNIEEFAKYIKEVRVTTVYGGASIEPQIKALKKGVQIIVGTPGRTLDLINKKKIKLAHLKWLVLDEADEMLNMGFKEDIDQILETTPENKQTLLFSATFPKEVEQIARNYLKNPLQIEAGKRGSGATKIAHHFYKMAERKRYPALKRIVDMTPDIYGIIFCRTRRETIDVADKLIKDGYNADTLHGDLSQSQRDAVMQRFRNKSIQILIATDVAARGLDIDNLSHVINYKLPDQVATYTHRSGRTGRAGNTGISITLVNPKDAYKLKTIEKKIGKNFIEKSIPSGKDICESQLENFIKKVKNTAINKAQIALYLENTYALLEDLDKETLVQKIISLELTQLLDYYDNQQNTDWESNKSHSGHMTRCFINIGRKDKTRPKDIIDMINELEVAKNIEIGAIEILNTFSFFEVENKHAVAVIDGFKNVSLDGGRKIIVEISNEKKKGGGNKRKGKFHGKHGKKDFDGQKRKKYKNVKNRFRR